MINTKLSNFVLLEVMGGLEHFVNNFDDYSQEDFDSLVDFKMSKTTTPCLYESILEKSISAQLGSRDGYLRELTQNGIDAYEPYSHKKIEFTTENQDDGSLILKVRDYGKGMNTQDVIKNLLIPYNSGKNGDLSKTGEHGLGFFSCFDIADWVYVTTGNGKSVQTTIYRAPDGWKTQIESYEEPFEGTEIKIHIPQEEIENMEYAPEAQLKKSLQKYVGFVNAADIDITLNNEPINVLRQKYQAMASEVVCNKSEEKQMTLYVKHETGKGWKPFIYTQNGLLVSDRFYYYNDCFNKRLADLITHSGFVLWMDLPRNIGLTKRRNGIVAEDSSLFHDVEESLFEEAMLRMFLSDTYTQKFDSRLTDLIDNLLEGTYKENIEDKVQRFGKDYFKNAGNNFSQNISNEQMKFFSELDGFAQRLMTKKMLFGILKNNSEEAHDTFSLMDIAAAYMKGEAFDIESDKIKDGLYVNLGNYSVQAILRFIDKKKNEWGILPSASMSKGTVINHTPIELFDKINREKGFGEEYSSFLEVVDYLDFLISEASDMGHSRVMLHKDISSTEIAHTDYNSISFNLNSDITLAWMDKICSGKLKDETLDSLLEVLLHEKSHIDRGVFDGKALHNTAFYKTKRELRTDFIIYCYEQKIDPMVKINEILQNKKITNRTNIDELKDLIEEYSVFLEQNND